MAVECPCPAFEEVARQFVDPTDDLLNRRIDLGELADRPLDVFVDPIPGRRIALRRSGRPVEVGEYQDVEQFGAGTEGVQAFLQSLLKLIRTRVNRRLTASPDSARPPAGCPLAPSYTPRRAEFDADAEANSTRPETG
jgi:hypothetical protein